MPRVMLKYGPLSIFQPFECHGVPKHVGLAPDGQIYLWAACLPSGDPLTYKVQLFATGYQEWYGEHVGTVVLPDGLVWHAIKLHE